MLGYRAWVFGGAGLAALVLVLALQHHDGAAAASQSWPPFVLVSGLLLIGLVANDDQLFSKGGELLARAAPNGVLLFCGATLLVGVVTAVLNLDTSVAFLTPVLVYCARSRGEGEAPLLYGSLLLANAGSLFLPGSNLTNLIVLGHSRVRGSDFFHTMWLPALGALVVTALVVATFGRAELSATSRSTTATKRAHLGIGIVAILGATVCVLSLSAPALPVAGIGIVAVLSRVAQRKVHIKQVSEVLGVSTLLGLFGASVALGTLGRVWSGPSMLLAHLDGWGTAGVAAVSTILVNNLPAASLLSARTPVHPYALLIGLNLGPNASVTGSLAWLLWLRSARTAGTQPSIRTASKIGATSVPLAIVVAFGLLLLTGSA